MAEKSPFSVETSSDDHQDQKPIPLARNSQRLLAFLIDYVFLSLIFSLVFSISQFTHIQTYILNQSSVDMKEFYKFLLTLYFRSFWIYMIFDGFLWASYFILFWRASGQTIGAKMMQILVIPSKFSLKKQANSWQIPWYNCFVRFFLFYFSLQIYGIPFLFVLDPRYNQRIHDFFSHTVVIDLHNQAQDKIHARKRRWLI